VTLDELPQAWDVVVVGAGVAGAMAALHLARLGMDVLLVEKSTWPRSKVCGGCLNAAALHALEQAGVGVTGRRYSHIRLACGSRTAGLPLPAGLAVTRRTLDAALVEHAVRAGACFLPATRADLGDATAHARCLVLRQVGRAVAISARVVLDCGGLASRLLPEAGWRIARNARIGVGACFSDLPAGYPVGVVHMTCARHGYVGVVRAEGERANLAAALDPGWCARAGGPGRAIRAILDEAGFPVFGELRTSRWHGTPRLTRRRCVFGVERVLVLGDAAGYVEPFTGEGMAWAIADAALAAPLVHAGVVRWNDGIVAQWAARHARMLRARRVVCRGVSGLLRRPRLLAAALPCLRAAPALAAPLSMWLNHDFGLATMVDE
jgi:flavin-dependent dehydrogenase